MAIGNASKLQIGIEGTYGVEATPEAQIRFSSEGFRYAPAKAEEGLLTGGKAVGRQYTMGVKAEGSLSTNVRPDEAGFWLGLGLGSEAAPALVPTATGAYKHVFTAIGTGVSDSLPSATAFVDRVVDQFAYLGMKVADFSFSAAPGDYLKIDINMVGKDEDADGIVLGALTPSNLKPFRFQHGVVKLANAVIADVTNITFNYNNSPEQDLQTTSTGIHYKPIEAGAREITLDLEVLYAAATEALRGTYYKTDAALSVELTFTSEEEVEEGFPYSLKISIPHAQLNDSGGNISGPERLRQSLALAAIEDNGDELITVELVNGRETAYI